MHRGYTGSTARIGSGKGNLDTESESYTLILAAASPVLPKQSAQMNEDEESSPFTNVTQVDSEDE